MSTHASRSKDQVDDNGRVEPFVLQSLSELAAQRPPADQELVHFTESLAQAVIEEYSVRGGRVLDPFAGYGTTLLVAERLGRSACGVELLPGRAAYIRTRLSADAEVVTGDARQLSRLVGGHFDLCFTSPPYMTANDHPENPLTGYATFDADYATYLEQIASVFRQVAARLRPGGYAVLNVANIVVEGVMTPLAWDVAAVVRRHLMLRQESFICWDRQPPGITGDYCLVFQRVDSS